MRIKKSFQSMNSLSLDEMPFLLLMMTMMILLFLILEYILCRRMLAMTRLRWTRKKK